MDLLALKKGKAISMPRDFPLDEAQFWRKEECGLKDRIVLKEKENGLGRGYAEGKNRQSPTQGSTTKFRLRLFCEVPYSTRYGN
jgi:hypothetical protein